MLYFQALLSAVVSTSLVLFVIGEDPYRNNGTSRWEAYDVHIHTTVAVAAGYFTASSRLLRHVAMGVLRAWLVSPV
jgi:hypothetical protein